MDPKRPPVPDMAKVDQERSSAAQLVWESSPGVFTAVSSSEPKWFKAVDGRWAAIDVSVAPVEGVAGVVSTRAGPWSATFAPIGPGTGGVLVRAEDGDVLSWRPSGVKGLVAPKVSEDGLVVTYRGVWPGVDLRYRLSTVGIAEEMVLTSPGVQATFAFDVDQRLVRDSAAEAEAAKLDKLPEVQRRIPRYGIEGVDGIELGAPKMLTGDGVPLSDAPVVSLAGDAGKGSVWTVGVDSAWLKSQPAEAFPLVLDPDVLFTTYEVGALKWLDMRNGGAFCGWNYPGVPDFCWPRNNNSWWLADYMWRSVIEFDTAALLGDEPGVTKTIQDAALIYGYVEGTTSVETIRTHKATAWTWFGGSPTFLGDAPFGTVGGIGGIGSSVNMNSTTSYMVSGLEPSGVANYKGFTAQLFVSWYENYTPVITGVTVPPIAAGPITEVSTTVWDGDTDQLLYTWEIATSPGFEVGTIVSTTSSGWTPSRSNSSFIGGATLRDGRTYWTRVKVQDQASHVTVSGPSPFRVEMRFGSAAVSGVDSFGPVGVNLFNGNVTTSVSTSQYPVVGGTLGMGLTYNSRDTQVRQGLPVGWASTLQQPEAEWVAARVNSGSPSAPASVTLSRVDGSKEEFLRTVSPGGTVFYAPPRDVYDSVTVGGSNQVLVSSPSGYDYEFNTGVLDAELLLKQVRSIGDILAPAMPTPTWTSGKLTSVTDPVSGQSMTVAYYGAGTCPTLPAGFVTATGMMCRVTVPGSQQTDFFYTGTAGSYRLARVVNPGAQVVDYVYGTGGRLVGVRDPRGADVVAAADSGVTALGWADKDTDATTTQWRLDYNEYGVSKVSSPVPSPGASRVARDYAVNSWEHLSQADAMVTPSGAPSDSVYFTFDTGGRQKTARTNTGASTTRTVTTTWNEELDVPLIVSDSGTGLSTTTRYDEQGRPVETYGPAPTSAFAAGLYPASGAPKTATFYDESITGLNARGWTNTALSGQPSHASVNFNNTNGLTYTDWGSGSPVGGGGDGWSARMTGDLTFNTTGSHGFEVWANVGYRVWVGNTLVLDQWSDPDSNPAAWVLANGNPSAPSYNKNSPGYYTAVAGQSAPIRVELRDDTGPARFALFWARPGGPGWEQIDAAKLSPELGLATSSVDADGHVARSTYGVTGISPVYGVVVTARTETAPSNLDETYGYETSSFLRRTSRQLPSGAGSALFYSYRNGTADDPCTAGTQTIPQAGRPWRTLAADPDGAGGQDALMYEAVYDAAGRARASTSGTKTAVEAGTNAWTCTSFDTRGRPTSTDYPAFGGNPARTVTSNYAVGSNPLVTSLTDPAGSITTTVDVMGRAVSSTDVWGAVTTSSYDTVGRPTGTTITKGAVSSARTVDYDSWGRVTTSRLDGQPIATMTYDAAERVTAVAYPAGTGNRGNGTTGAFVYSAQTGLNDKVTWNQAGGALMTSDEVTSRWLTNRIRNQAVDGTDVNGGTDNYSYDGAWRLTAAVTPNTGGSRTTSYGYADTSAGCAATGAGKNSNRTSKTTAINGGPALVQSYCYDHADRLVSTTDAAAGTASTATGTLAYDNHGNTTVLGWQAMTYDAANRHVETKAAALNNSASAVQIKTASSLCVDVEGPSVADGAILQQWSCNNPAVDQQVWSLVAADGQWFNLVSHLSGKCIAPQAGGTADGTKLVQGACDQTAAVQQFRLDASGSGLWRLVSRLSGKCVDVPSGGSGLGVDLQLLACTSGTTASKQFTLNDTAGATVTPATVRALASSAIPVAGKTNVALRARGNWRCADVRGPSPADGTVIQQWTCNTPSVSQQAVDIVDDGGGNQVKVKFRNANKCLQAQPDNTVVQSTCSAGATSQRWTFSEHPRGWRLAVGSSGKCLNSSPVGGDGVGLTVAACAGTPSPAELWSVTNTTNGAVVDVDADLPPLPKVAYARDVTDSIVERKVNGTTVARYSGPFTLNSSNMVTDITVSLPGGAVLRYTPGNYGGMWTYPNLAGHNVATSNSVGVKQGVTTFYDADGMLAGGSLPDTHPGSFDNTWHGGGDVKVETETGLQPVIEMGARQYHIALGRFLEVDPIEGGVHNDYGYVADPINTEDRNGTGPIGDLNRCRAWADWVRNYRCAWSYSIGAAGAELRTYIWATKFDWDAGLINAFRHAMWNIMIIYAFDVTTAVYVTESHETDYSQDSMADYRNNLATQAWVLQAKIRGVKREDVEFTLVGLIRRRSSMFDYTGGGGKNCLSTIRSSCKYGPCEHSYPY